jgi:cytochrome c oxidase subunit I
MRVKDNKLSMAYLFVAYIALFIGAICGLLQGLSRGGIITLPTWINYYQILTAHGVLLALVYTTFFIYGFYFAGIHKTIGEFSEALRKTGWIGYILMTIGTLLATIMILSNEASVLYTFYAPLKAHPLYYIGLALFVIGTWVSGIALMVHTLKWKKQNPKLLTPLFGHLVTGTILLWIICSLGVAAEVLFQLLPWSLGIQSRINVLLSRTLFWYFGHPLVYFWLLPAYAYWYVCVPRIIGGKIFSDALARLAFVLFLLFSIPVGFHHQLEEAGISPFWKYVQVTLTLMVAFPSMLTAFSMFATFELAGRDKGAKGVFGWFKKLPFHDVRFLAPFIGMLFFIPAGTGGILNVSMQLNEIVHNTMWVVGHFHITVGTTVALTFFGITYWLVPYLTGKKLTKTMNQLGILQVIFWSIGMFIMSTSMHALGLYGAPRRTAFTTYGDNPVALNWFSGIVANHHVVAAGGFFLFLSAMMMVYFFFYLVFFAPKVVEEGDLVHFPIAEVDDHAQSTPPLFDNWKIWIALSVVLIIFAYGFPIMDMIQHAPPGSLPHRTW